MVKWVFCCLKNGCPLLRFGRAVVAMVSPTHAGETDATGGQGPYQATVVARALGDFRVQSEKGFFGCADYSWCIRKRCRCSFQSSAEMLY